MNALIDNIKNALKEFIDIIAVKYNIDKDELISNWNTISINAKKPVKKVREVCSALVNGVRCTVKLDYDSKEIYCKKHSVPVKRVVEEKIERKKIEVKKNKWGRYEILGYGKLIVDRNLNSVVGKQLSDGTVDSLDENDILICEQNKIPYSFIEK
jgi:hypothetical protein